MRHVYYILAGMFTTLHEGYIARDPLPHFSSTPRNCGLQHRLAMVGTEGSPDTNSEVLKNLVSWEPLTVNPKYRDPFKLHPMCLVTQASNPAPQFDDDSEAMVRRVIAMHMTYQESEQAKILDLAEKVKRDEYALLVAFALIGAGEVVEAGTIVVPKSIADFSANIVRPVRPVDRFMDLLEYGHFEVADDELYEAYCQTCVKQKLTQGPRSDFLEAFERRLRRAGRRFLRRAGAELYVAQTYINSRNERPLLVPQLQATEHIDIFLGLRIGQGPFGPAIGQAIPEVRRRVPRFEAVASAESATSDQD